MRMQWKRGGESIGVRRLALGVWRSAFGVWRSALCVWWRSAARTPGGQCLDRFNDKMDQVILRHPIPQLCRQEHRRISIDFNQTFTHCPILTKQTFYYKALSNSHT